jgi:hypothetical protein
MSWLFCCAKRATEEESSIGGIDSKLKNSAKILIEFVQEEAKIGIKEYPCIELVEKVLLVANKSEIPKQSLIELYQELDRSSSYLLKHYMSQEFFFTDNTRTRYSFPRVMLFNILYSGGKEGDKANFLYNMIESTSSGCVHNNSQRLVSTLEDLVMIPCNIVGEIINSSRTFSTEQEEE